MTSSLEAPRPGLAAPGPKWLRDLASARTHYEERFGWPVSVRVAERQLVVAIGQLIDAITMPAELGARVQAQLVIAMLAGPVLRTQDGRYWTFLAQSDPDFRGDLGDAVAGRGVRREAAGTRLPVPTGDPARWVTPPRPNRVLPPVYAVAATTRRVCAA